MADTKVANVAVAGVPTRSLRASANPQARMQELLKQDSLPDQDSPPNTAVEVTALLDIPTIINPNSNATSSEVAQIESSADVEIDSSATAKKPRQTDSQKPRSTTAQKSGSLSLGDPVHQAMLGMLSLPYPDDMAEGAMTVTSVKIPKPIWERLEYARTLTKKDKQDIIADALRIYFELIVEGGLEK